MIFNIIMFVIALLCVCAIMVMRKGWKTMFIMVGILALCLIIIALSGVIITTVI